MSAVGEVGGDLLGHLAGGGPFRAALEGGDEGHALQFLGRVAQGVLEHAALAVLDGEQDRLVLVGAALLLRGEGRGQHGQVLGRAAEPAVKLVGHVHELRGQALGDRDGSARGRRSGRAAPGRGEPLLPGRVVADDLAVAPADVGAGLLGRGRPSRPGRSSRCTLSTWGRPPGEVVDHQPAAVCDVIDQGLLRLLAASRRPGSCSRPRCRRRSSGLKPLMSWPLGGEVATSTVNRPVSSSIFFKHRRGPLPVVAVLAVDDQGLVGLRQGHGSQQDAGRHGRQTALAAHRSLLVL